MTIEDEANKWVQWALSKDKNPERRREYDEWTSKLEHRSAFFKALERQTGSIDESPPKLERRRLMNQAARSRKKSRG